MSPEYKAVHDAIRAHCSDLTRDGSKPSAETVTHALYAALRECARAEGQKPQIEVFMRKPGEARHFSDATCWVVAWEAGPYEWAIGAAETVSAVTGRLAEPYYSFDLCLYENE